MKRTTHTSRNVTRGVLDYLNEIGEQRILPEVTRSLEEVSEKAKKTDEITVTSAVPMTGEQLKLLKSILSRTLGVNLPMKNKVDKSLVGGFTVKVADWFLDASIAHQLQMLKRSLLFS